jgi:hypothetical protein
MAKESEERPNDPISERGLAAMMGDLAASQESLKETQQVGKFAFGGNKFDGGGNKGNQTLNYNNSTAGLYFGLTPEQFNPYASDGTIDWNIMYGSDSPYTKRRKYVLDNWDSQGVQDWLGRYVEGINAYNKDRKGYQPMSKEDITKDIFSKRTWDKSWGGMHAGIDYAGNPEETLVTEHMLRGTDGSLTAMPESDIYYAGSDFNTGRTWNDRFKDKYTRANNGNYTEQFDPKTNTRTRRYFYDPVTKEETPEVEQPAQEEEEEWKPGKYNTWLQYAPAIGFGISAITDAAGLTNKPDYSNADAILEASKGAGTYNPVRFKPIGNYLTYRPFDRDYYINKMNAEAGASRRNIMNTSGGNRGAAMAGILAADNNYLNQLGTLSRQAEEYNLAQRQQVADFNRSTNITNSQGFLQADLANQKAAAEAREMSLKGTMAAAEMREKTKLASDAAKAANLSGFVTSLGDIGRENMAWNWRNFGLATDTFGSVDTNSGKLLTHSNTKKSKEGEKKANGGKIKKRKGLTI